MSTGFYRELKTGDTFQCGDQWLHPIHDKWYEIGSEISGNPVDADYKYRRPISIPLPEQPSYRDLAPDEWVQAGDEVFLRGGWVGLGPAHPRVGERAGPEDWYRRKVSGEEAIKFRKIRCTTSDMVVSEDKKSGDLLWHPNDPKGAAGAAKCPMHLLPAAALQETAWVHGHGAAKYGPWNWRESKVNAATYVAAIMRHLDAWREGEDLDPESGRSHLAHIAASVNILLDSQTHGCLIDDRVKTP